MIAGEFQTLREYAGSMVFRRSRVILREGVCFPRNTMREARFSAVSASRKKCGEYPPDPPARAPALAHARDGHTHPSARDCNPRAKFGGQNG